jgi:hypothetical protein
MYIPLYKTRLDTGARVPACKKFANAHGHALAYTHTHTHLLTTT